MACQHGFFNSRTNRPHFRTRRAHERLPASPDGCDDRADGWIQYPRWAGEFGR
jgi:hypothetical protein